MAREPDFEATFRRADANGTVSLSIIRSGQSWTWRASDTKTHSWRRGIGLRYGPRTAAAIGGAGTSTVTSSSGRGAGRTIPPQNHARIVTNTKVTRRHVRDASSPFLIERDATSDASPHGRRATRIGFRSNCSRTSASSPIARARVRRPSLVPYAVTREKLRSRSRPISSAARIASQRPDSPTRP